MKIIKRNGAEVPFDITKIITAVTKASDSVGGQSRLTREQITQIAAPMAITGTPRVSSVRALR